MLSPPAIPKLVSGQAADLRCASSSILRLRSDDNDSYNDFWLIAGKLAPQGFDLATGVVTDTDGQALDFLNKSVPLWPVLDL